MSEYFAPNNNNQSFNTENLIDQNDENVSMERLEEEFAKKFNTRLFNDCSVDGNLEISESLSINNIRSLTSDNITFNNSIDLKNNKIYFGNESIYAPKIQKKTYQINGTTLQIPINAKDEQNIYLINVSRADGVFDFANNCPLFVSYFLLSKISYVRPIPFIQNLVESYEYSIDNNVLTLHFSKDFSNLSVNVAISQIQ